MYEHTTCSSHFPNNQLFSPHKLDHTSGIYNNTNNITHNKNYTIKQLSAQCP